MSEYKVLLTGPVGAGKTTAVQTLTMKSLVDTDVSATDFTLNRKATTTVAMDYGVYELGDGERVHLYGTPGQERFSFMWDILLNGACGLIVLVDNSRESPIQDMKFYLDMFRSFVDKANVVIGVTCVDKAPAPAVNEYSAALAGMGLDLPVFAVDTRESDDVLTLVKAITDALDSNMNELQAAVA